MMRTALVALAAVALAASAGDARPGTATKYRPENLFGGYSEKQVEPDVWRVSARSNGVAEQGFARNMAIFRAAEILQAQGFTHVQVIDQKGQALMRRSGADMQAVGESMKLWVRGAMTDALPADCRAKVAELCFTVPIARTMERVRPLLTFPGDGS